MTGAKCESGSHSPSAFLDSGVLVDLFILWDACRAVPVRLDEITSWSELNEALATAGAAVDGLKYSDDINRGTRLFANLCRSSERYLYLSSRVCWSEAHHTLLEARGLETLVRRGVPSSLRVKRPLPLYRVALTDEDYAELESDIGEFRYSLQFDYGIDVRDVDEPAAGLGLAPEDIWDSARVIRSRILMTVVDAHACASAVLAEAAFFVSGDSSLRGALKQIREPDDDWEAAAESLRDALGVAQLTDFPRPVTPATALSS